ncbi:MAG: glycosyltransferase [Candidatus Aenigmatarchaeota archaeon]
MKIFFLPAHEPIDSELIDRWIYFGYEIVIPKNSPFTWNKKLVEMPKDIILDVNEKPDIIFCDAHPKNIFFSFKYKIRKFWYDVPIVVSHIWFPDIRILPLYYMVNHISVCRYGAEYLKRISGLESKLIYLPVDTEFFKPRNAPNKKIATIIGNNFNTRKIMGTKYLFKIFNLVHEMDPEIKLIINGYNPDLEVPPFVKKTFYPGDYKKGLYKVLSYSSCIFFTTTRNLIMHSLENAMSAGKVCICWDLPAFHEVIKNGKSGFLIENFDERRFAEKIVEICNKPPKKIGERARESIVEKCERNTVAKKYIEFFEEILS